MRTVSDKSYRGTQKTHFVFGNFFFSKIVIFVRKCEKILYSGAGHRWQNGARALHTGYLRLHTHTNTNKICNTFCFSTANVVAIKRLNVTCVRSLPVFYLVCISSRNVLQVSNPLTRSPEIRITTFSQIRSWIAICSFSADRLQLRKLRSP
jgi:hypothetical protein